MEHIENSTNILQVAILHIKRCEKPSRDSESLVLTVCTK